LARGAFTIGGKRRVVSVSLRRQAAATARPSKALPTSSSIVVIDTTLVLLPGLDGTEVFFRPLMERLPATIRPLALNYPDAGPHGYRALLDFVRRELADIPRYVVLASSFSGPLAVMLAAAEPRKVRGVILAATFASSPNAPLTRLRFVVRTPLVAVLRFARRLPIWMLRPRQDALRIAKQETWTRVSARGLAGRARAALGADMRETLGRCRQPFLCVTYDADDVVPPWCADEIRGHCTHARRVTLPGGHLAMFSDPGLLAAEIVRFVEVDCAPAGVRHSQTASA
jgi:pimeloyl-[acyl-carrier protein] methyl ester esterase